MQTIQQTLTTALAQNKLTLPSQATDQLAHYLDMLKTWNKVFNLTSITTPHDMVYLHLIDSLMVQPYLHGTQCLDVGSGGGIPGIPLAIVNPHQHWTLLDKNSKKTRFITQAIAELRLTNAESAHSRCEEFHPDSGFDTIISRAFSTLRTFVETTQHLLSPDGVFLAMKGKYPQDELSDLPTSCTATQTVNLAIKGINVERHVVCLKHS